LKSDKEKNDLKEKKKKFIGYLLQISEPGKENRAALADLRSGLGKKPGEMARVHKHVVPFLPHKTYNDECFYLTATLFGLFPKQREKTSLGAAFRPLKQKSESMSARFDALLSADPDDLGNHLRYVISLLKSNDLPFNWFQFLDDISRWDHPDREVQLGWARDFYKYESNEDNNSNNENNNLQENNND
jgi:CRISPR system Cascade subunit CasB